MRKLEVKKGEKILRVDKDDIALIEFAIKELSENMEDYEHEGEPYLTDKQREDIEITKYAIIRLSYKLDKFNIRRKKSKEVIN